MHEQSSFFTQWVSKNRVNPLENILLPSVHNVFDVYIPSEAVMIRNTCELNSYVNALVATIKRDHTLRKRLPVLKLPLHFYLLVFLDSHVFTLDRISVHSMQATRS